ncbi:hypothetical protein HUA76_03325 [Myxococcus sp. CA056]|uniref:DUF6068 family protein n=1 Tax=Myxococcus sp. CA056 TaxID=2741740 RepID=UPI00157B4A7E|nr:DUF6068 family protein [Myxococcus sp. CA056]NTX09808.1 hypothetical protein [Myxococcus sp. CA056]
MRKPTATFLSRSALVCAALALGAGCESTKPRAVSPTDGVPVTQGGAAEGPTEAATPESPAPQKGNSPWQRARVGDKVVYAFSGIRGQPGDANGAAAAGKLTLEVAAVEGTWVWLTLGFTSDSGKPLEQPKLSRVLTFPMRTDTTRTLEAEREGTQSAEQPTAAGRTWEAKRYLRDNRPVDGPLENRLYAVDAGPLYLTNGLLDASTTLAGFRVPGSYQLTLVEVKQGTGDAGKVPERESPLGPGTWFDFEAESEGTKSVLRTCLGAERGFVLRSEGLAPAGSGGEPCKDFAQAGAVPLEEALLSFLWDALDPKQWPPAIHNAAPPVRETLTVGTKKLAVLQLDSAEGAEGLKQVGSRMFAADPWDKTLSGLAHEARFSPLSDFLYRVAPKGKRESMGGRKLVDWGAWQP